LDSGQTIATITQDQTGAAVATLTNTPNDDVGQIDMGIEEVWLKAWFCAVAVFRYKRSGRD